MTRTEIVRRARLVIARELVLDMRKVSEAAEFVKDLGADSLDMVALPRAIEEEFGILLSDEEVAFAQTVGTALDLIETKIENRRAL